MKKLLFVIPALALFAAGCNSTTLDTNNTTPSTQSDNSSQTAKLFTSASGQYIFRYPAVWTAEVNQNNRTNTLFGPGATSSSGLGGVEVVANQTSIDSFLAGAADYSNKTNVIVDGVAGIRGHHAGAVRGESVSILKDGKIYNIYINSENPEHIRYFEQIIATFQFAPV